jgi:ABC-2 type transport system permease protein
MNLAIWKKAVSDAWRSLVISSAILILFSWLFVWLMSLLEVGAWAVMLSFLPDVFKPLVGVEIAKLATRTGQLSVLYVHVVTLLVCVGWAVGRGSDSVSGEIARGTMDLILSLPVWRATVLAAPAVVATLGAAVLAASIWVGTWLGLLTFDLRGNVSPGKLAPGAVNLFAMTFCFMGITTFVSSWNRDRWRTIALSGVFFVISLIIKMVARLWEAGSWLTYCSFLSAFRPQLIILEPEETGWLALPYNLPLLVLGLIGHLAAAAIFTYRDIPVPK